MSRTEKTRTDNPLADKRVRSLIGFSGALVIAVVAIVFLEGIAQWIGLGIAVLDAAVTPYILGLVVEEDR